MKGIDVARNLRFGDDDVRQLMEKCPNLEFLDAPETGVTIEIIKELARKWGHYLHNLSLPNTVAIQLKRPHHTGGVALNYVVGCI